MDLLRSRSLVELETIEEVGELAKVDDAVIPSRGLDEEVDLLVHQTSARGCLDGLQPLPRFLLLQLPAPIHVQFFELGHDLLGMIAHTHEELLKLPDAHDAVVVLVESLKHGVCLLLLQAKLRHQHLHRLALVQVPDIVLHVTVKQLQHVFRDVLAIESHCRTGVDVGVSREMKFVAERRIHRFSTNELEDGDFTTTLKFAAIQTGRVRIIVV